MLAADHQVFAPDLPGQGGSMPWRGRANQRTFEEVLRWLLDAWQLPAVTLVGMSMGGSIATGFTLRNPQRVNGLVLVNPTGVQARLPHHLLAYLTLRLRVFGPLAARLLRLHRFFARTAAERIFFAAPHQVPDLEDILQEMREEARARGSVFADWHHDAISRRSMRINHLPQLSQITCPTMVIHGDQDPIVPLSAAQQAAEVSTARNCRWCRRRALAAPRSPPSSTPCCGVVNSQVSTVDRLQLGRPGGPWQPGPSRQIGVVAHRAELRPRRQHPAPPRRGVVVLDGHPPPGRSSRAASTATCRTTDSPSGPANTCGGSCSATSGGTRVLAGT